VSIYVSLSVSMSVCHDNRTGAKFSCQGC